MKIPSHYRQLRPDEVIRRGDRWQTMYGGLVGKVKASIGKTPRTHTLAYTYWRRRHVRVGLEPQKKAPVERNPLVRFTYPSSKEPWNFISRTVRLIGADAKYFIGIEVTDKNRFKKFLRAKASAFQMLEFSPESIS